jgi:hypothetical protein
MKNITAVLVCMLLPVSASAASFNTFLAPLNNPMLDIVSQSNGSVLYSGQINSGSTSYDTVTGEGTFDLSATLPVMGDTFLHASLTTNTNGSLHLDGLINFASIPATAYNFIGDIMVIYDYDIFSDVAAFIYSPISRPGLDYPGLLMQSGPFTGFLLDFEVGAAFLAHVDNPYPAYLPLPGSAWLMLSGLLTLVGYRRRRVVMFDR